ncbi:hypothetical protein [Kitasatospora sp. NPDC050543]|uniref:hypothetical protein n=1 Tax=Kitasatospora sp. NPDC050543 TaxID=3364054 RepID=UPI00378B9A75
MRPTRTAAAALIGATALIGLTAPSALAKDGERASVSPSQAAPGQTVTVSVSCGSTTAKTITASSPAFEGGPATLTLGSDGRHTGSARLAGKSSGDEKVDGQCPDGVTFSTTVTVTTAAASLPATATPGGALDEWSKAAGEWAGGAIGQPASGQEGPHGAVETGLGGSVASSPAELTAGALLVASGIGGFWLLRRRGGTGSA